MLRQLSQPFVFAKWLSGTWPHALSYDGRVRPESRHCTHTHARARVTWRAWPTYESRWVVITDRLSITIGLEHWIGLHDLVLERTLLFLRLPDNTTHRAERGRVEPNIAEREELSVSRTNRRQALANSGFWLDAHRIAQTSFVTWTGQLNFRNISHFAALKRNRRLKCNLQLEKRPIMSRKSVEANRELKSHSTEKWKMNKLW